MEIPKSTKPTGSFDVDDIFGSNLRKSGSIVRGFTLGTNRDLSLNSGFRMQMSGNLLDDLEVVATLTDENSPIQPEGTTQTLQEVDKVFIELRSSSYSAAMGDINLDISGNEFGNLSRKMSGAKGFAKYRVGDLNGDVLIAGAVTRGKYTSNQFLGVDGVQGPYRLVDANGSRTIIVIAGTERVYINGEKMTRGENNDYIIDYSTAEITFTPKRYISKDTRIVVDFEYNDRQYNRNLWGAKTGFKLFNNNLNFNTTFITESDSKNNPIDISFTEEDKKILRSAGGNRYMATKTGVELSGIGKGQYKVLDSIITIGGKDTVLKIYEFAPTDTINAIYSVSFSFVGFGRGSYKKVASGQYKFVGINQGSYEPIRFLPLPQSNRLIDFDFNGQPTDNLNFNGEYALSNFNSNQFSDLPEAKINGTAFKFGMAYSLRDMKIAKFKLGSIDFAVKDRYINKDFVAMDRFNEVEYNRKWNLIDTFRQNENSVEGVVTYIPVSGLSFKGEVGRLNGENQMLSDRYSINIRTSFDNLPDIDYKLERIKTDRINLAQTNDWIRQSGLAKYQYGIISPRLKISHEYLGNKGTDPVNISGKDYRWNELTPGFTLNNNKNISFSADVGWQAYDSLYNGALARASNIFIQNYTTDWFPASSFFTRLELGFNHRRYTEAFKQRGNKDVDVMLVRLQTRASPFDRAIETDWFYEVSTGQASKLERVFQRVPKGTGNYIYLGDVNNNHIVDPQDFQLSRFDGEYISLTLPTDEMVPIIDLKASSRVRLVPERIVSQRNWIGKGISTLSSETYLRIEEKSREEDKKKIYLLRMDNFQKEGLTIIGSNLITQDLYFLENNPMFNLRYRYTQRKSLTEYAQSVERTNSHENSVRVRFQLIKEISNQSEYSQKIDVLSADGQSQRSRKISFENISVDWSYRPIQDFELGFKFEIGSSKNFDTSGADINSQAVRCVYSFIENGQMRGEFIRDEVLLHRVGALFPFELTNGRIEGKSWIWSLSFEYRILKFLQMDLNYQGRSEGRRSIIHNGKAEVRAFF